MSAYDILKYRFNCWETGERLYVKNEDLIMTITDVSTYKDKEPKYSATIIDLKGFRYKKLKEYISLEGFYFKDFLHLVFDDTPWINDRVDTMKALFPILDYCNDDRWWIDVNETEPGVIEVAMVEDNGLFCDDDMVILEVDFTTKTARLIKRFDGEKESTMELYWDKLFDKFVISNELYQKVVYSDRREEYLPYRSQDKAINQFRHLIKQ